MPVDAASSRSGRRWVCTVWISLFLGCNVLTTQASELRRTPVVRAVERNRNAVVNIHGRKTMRSSTDPRGAEAFKQVNGMGTGCVVDQRGYVVTNYHVVEGVASIRVTLANNETVRAHLVAHDPGTDLAVIKIDTDQPMQVITIGSSEDLMPGEPVIAVGNAYGYSHTVTQGIISALHRPVPVSEEQTYQNLIQTDASINPGNSGGPLLNIDGEMIGINVAVRMGAQGIGFALPIDEALEVVARLMSVNRLDGVSHGIIGATLRKDGQTRFVINRVEPGSAADRCGLKRGDRVVSVAGVEVCRTLDFERALLGRRLEQTEIETERDGESTKVAFTFSTRAGESRGPVVAANSTNNTNRRIWDVLGVELTPVGPESLPRTETKYRGGLRVDAVRGGSAAEGMLRAGDILIVIHKWETASLSHMAYILNSREFQEAQPAKFLIVRDKVTYMGQLRASLDTTTHASFNR